MRFLLLFSALLAILQARADVHCNSSRGFTPFGAPEAASLRVANPQGTDKAVTLPECSVGTGALYINLRASNLSSSPKTKYRYTTPEGSCARATTPRWGVRLYSAGKPLDVCFSAAVHEDGFGMELPSVAASVSYDTSLIINKSWTSKVGFGEEPNLLIIERNADEPLAIRFGNEAELHRIIVPGWERQPIDSAAIILTPAAEIRVDCLTIRGKELEISRPRRNVAALIDEASTSADPIVGVYELYDFDFDPAKVMLPDRLRLVVVADGEKPGAYAAYYLSGTPPDGKYSFAPGQLKALLSPSPFPDVCYLDWRSDDGLDVSRGATATLDSKPLIICQFPYQNVKFTMRRIPDPSLIEIPTAYE